MTLKWWPELKPRGGPLTDCTSQVPQEEHYFCGNPGESLFCSVGEYQTEGRLWAAKGRKDYPWRGMTESHGSKSDVYMHCQGLCLWRDYSIWNWSEGSWDSLGLWIIQCISKHQIIYVNGNTRDKWTAVAHGGEMFGWSFELHLWFSKWGSPDQQQQYHLRSC